MKYNNILNNLYINVSYFIFNYENGFRWYFDYIRLSKIRIVILVYYKGGVLLYVLLLIYWEER